MKFGKLLQRFVLSTNPTWRDSFLDYKGLKKRLKHLRPTTPPRMASDNQGAAGEEAAAGGKEGEGAGAAGEGANIQAEEREFVRLIREQMTKFNEFFMDKEEEYVMRIQHLDDQLSELRPKTPENADAAPSTTGNDADDDAFASLRTQYVVVHGELVLLLSWSQLNYQGLVKILKKHDKHSSLTLKNPLLRNALGQPFKSDEVLKGLVAKAEQRFTELGRREASAQPTEGVALLALGTEDLANDPDAELTEELRRSTEAALLSWQSLRPGAGGELPPGLGDDEEEEDSDDERAAAAEAPAAKRARTSS